jgi:hypothetical protein
MNDGNEWETVKQKKGRGTKKVFAGLKELGSKSTTGISQQKFETAFDVSEVLANVNSCIKLLKESHYFKHVIDSISEKFGPSLRFQSIIALGIGSLTSRTSILQLALYLCICDSLLEKTASQYESCEIFDPNLLSSDYQVYEFLKIKVMSINVKGKHKADLDRNTLYFCPHCPYRLYCNILWANWDNLDNIYIFGNR